MRSEHPFIEVRNYLENELRIARFERGTVQLLDRWEPIRFCEPPSSLRQSSGVWEGLEYLRIARPPVALFLTLHFDGTDFARLLEHSEGTFLASPVVGVEAAASQESYPVGGVPRPETQQTNPWLRTFQSAEFPWMDDHGITMLPCEPQWEGDLAGHLDQIGEILGALKEGHVPSYSDEAQRLLLHPVHLYMSVFRAWGILGQFGYWLSRPGVQEKFMGAVPRSPITLGPAHIYEGYILKQYCDLDVVTQTLDRKLEGDPYGVPTKDVEQYYLLFAGEVGRGGMAISDLEVKFPL